MYLIMLVWSELASFLHHINFLQLWQRQKILSILTIPLFILCWPLFTDDWWGALWACFIPLLIILKMFIVGLGYLRDDEAVYNNCRYGDKKEMLKGPLFLTICLLIATAFYWKSIRAVVALFTVCFGDGVAEIFGRFFGSWNKLPWNSNKSLVGLISFVTFSTLATYLFLTIYHSHSLLHQGEDLNPNSILRRAFLTSVFAGLAETLPIKDYDNFIVFFVAAIADRVFHP